MFHFDRNPLSTPLGGDNIIYKYLSFCLKHLRIKRFHLLFAIELFCGTKEHKGTLATRIHKNWGCIPSLPISRWSIRLLVIEIIAIVGVEVDSEKKNMQNKRYQATQNKPQ